MRSYLKFLASSADKQKLLDKGSKIPDQVLKEVEQIEQYLRSRGIDPAKARIAVTGAGGTGKSTLARALASRVGSTHNLLDEMAPVRRKGARYARDFSGVQFDPGTVSEQTHLLTEVDPNKFDVLIHLETPHSQVKDNLLKRGRGAYQEDLWNYPKVQKVLQEAFNSAGGEVHEFSSGRVKVSTPQSPAGFKNQEQYVEEVKDRFGSSKRIKTRKDAILSNAVGKPKSHRGLATYVKGSTPLRYGTGAAAGGGLAGGAALYGTADQTYGDAKKRVQ
jgi:broad-specificity NMP kinase